MICCQGQNAGPAAEVSSRLSLVKDGWFFGRVVPWEDDLTGFSVERVGNFYFCISRVLLQELALAFCDARSFPKLVQDRLAERRRKCLNRSVVHRTRVLTEYNRPVVEGSEVGESGMAVTSSLLLVHLRWAGPVSSPSFFDWQQPKKQQRCNQSELLAATAAKTKRMGMGSPVHRIRGPAPDFTYQLDNILHCKLPPPWTSEGSKCPIASCRSYAFLASWRFCCTPAVRSVLEKSWSCNCLTPGGLPGLGEHGFFGLIAPHWNLST